MSILERTVQLRDAARTEVYKAERKVQRSKRFTCLLLHLIIVVRTAQGCCADRGVGGTIPCS